jgi:hypothetical protein
MPIPAAPAGNGDGASTVLDRFGQLHAQIRSEIAGLDDEGLNWLPGTDTNTIATIVTHLLGSEAETLRCVAGMTCDRDRGAEFSRPGQSVADIATMLDDADRLLAEVRPRIDGDRLAAVVALPTLPPEERRSGLTWLVGNYGHAKEHVGQIQLTKQLDMAGRAV